MKVAIAVTVLLVLTLYTTGLPAAFAHNELTRGDINIEGGWGEEPPLVGELNTIVLKITKVSDNSAITNALAQVDIQIQKGGESKALEFIPQEEAGLYAAEVLPTQLGQYAITFSGQIAGQAIDGQIEIEDVEDTRRLSFPEASSGANEGQVEQLSGQLTTIISDLTSQVEESKSAAQDARNEAQTATQMVSGLVSASDRTFVLAMIGIGLGIAGIAIAAISFSRKFRMISEGKV